MHLNQATPELLREQEILLNEKYGIFRDENLNLDLTRGKPNTAQLDLSNELDGILKGNYTDNNGADLRNYGGLDGIPEAKELFSDVIGLNPEEMIIGGNASLALMYFSAHTALHHGLSGSDSAWSREGKSVKFIAPVPGYDRHFAVCEHLGIELIPVTMTDEGPDMDEVERLVKADPSIKGIWCVPRFSNPTGIVYSNDTVSRIAKLGHVAGSNFLVFWDNAYAVHAFEENAPELANVMDYCREEGTENNILIFGSTSKVTLAGAGVAFLGGSSTNLAGLKNSLGYSTIGPDKINQLRHVKFLVDRPNLNSHMKKHAEIIKPRFDAVLKQLQESLGDAGMGDWTTPQGGYFVSFNSLPHLAREIVKLAADVGVKLTPAGATFPYGNDPNDNNIRLAPTFPSVTEIEKAMEVFVVCVQLASIRQKLNT
ncbi:MAG: aspartate/methionine/tyrosine aminotransferase [Oceanicoccus sp.]